MRTGPNVRKRADGRFEARYEKGRNEAGRIIYGYCYGKTYEAAEAKRAKILGEKTPQHDVFPLPDDAEKTIRKMNLLILGAGGYGLAVKEIADALRLFNDIAFLDDDPANDMAIAPLSDYIKLLPKYAMAIPAFSDGRLRKHWADELESNGYIVPSLIHPSVALAASAVVHRSVIIGKRCIISAGVVIGRGAFLSDASVVDVATQIGEFSSIGASVTTEQESVIEDFEHIASGTIVHMTR